MQKLSVGVQQTTTVLEWLEKALIYFSVCVLLVINSRNSKETLCES